MNKINAKMNEAKKRLDKINNPKRQEREFSSWWKRASKAFVPAKTRQLLEQRRGPRVLQSLAVSECERALVIAKMDVKEEEAMNYAQPDTGYIYLNFKKTDSDRFKKIVAMHEASHLTLTPGEAELTAETLNFVKDYHILVNILEDVRCNRYLCLKYPGMVRYFDSELREENHELLALSIGDLTGNELEDIPPTLEVFFEIKDLIRSCTSFSDVIRVAKKIVKENELDEQRKKSQPEEGSTPSPDSDSQKKVKYRGGLSKEQLEHLADAEKKNEKSSRIMDTKRNDSSPPGTFGIGSNNERRRVTIVKREKAMFLGSLDDFKKATLSKHTMKMLSKKHEGWKRTKEGRLNKINLSKLYSNGSMFKRRHTSKAIPKAYMVLDGSGSMWTENRSWQKGLVMGLISLFKELNVPYQIFIHSGDSGKFYYSEIEDKDVPHTGAYCYTLDGSMLEALFEREIDPKEKALVFYFSDGQIPAQYPDIQVPLVEKYNMIAEKRGTPIFGIGLNITSVDYFTHWHIVKNKKDFEKTLDKIGKQLRRYV